MPQDFDVIVIGAGLSGLMAAVCGSAGGANVALLEKQALPGRKYLAAAMGKGPLSNARVALDSFHGRDARFVSDALAALPLVDLCKWFAAHGLTVSEAEHYGLMLPEGGADAALAALVRGLGGTQFLAETRAATAVHDHDGFRVTLDDGQTLRAQKLVLACGGSNLPQCGGEPTGLEIAQSFGHNVKPTGPAHVGLAVRETWTRELASLWMDVRLTLASGRNVLRETTGALLFTRLGVTGEAVFNVSSLAADQLAQDKLPELRVNFFPEMPPDEVSTWLFRTLGERVRVPADRALAVMLPHRLAVALLAQQRIKPGARVQQLEGHHRDGLLSDMTALPLTVRDTFGMKAAEAMAGGLNVRQIDPRTMQSRLQPGLFIVGQMLDVEPDWGGHLQHFSLASGLLAGRAAAE